MRSEKLGTRSSELGTHKVEPGAENLQPITGIHTSRRYFNIILFQMRVYNKGSLYPERVSPGKSAIRTIYWNNI